MVLCQDLVQLKEKSHCDEMPSVIATAAIQVIARDRAGAERHIDMTLGHDIM